MKFILELLEGSKEYRKLRQARKADTKANIRTLKKFSDESKLPYLLRRNADSHKSDPDYKDDPTHMPAFLKRQAD